MIILSIIVNMSLLINLLHPEKFSRVLFMAGIFFMKFIFFVIDVDTSRKTKHPIDVIIYSSMSCGKKLACKISRQQSTPRFSLTAKQNAFDSTA